MPYRIPRFIVLTALLGFYSCKLEPCKDYPCVNGTPLEDGKDCYCNCKLGWSGLDCTEEDKCVTNQVVCFNGGFCNDEGVCTCLTGYEGDSCELLSRDRFLTAGDTSNWSAIDTCTQGSQQIIYQYAAEITDGSENRRLEIYNIRELGELQFIEATVNKFTCDQTTDVLIGNVEIRNFFGTISSDSLTLRVHYDSDDGLTFTCKGTWMRE